MTWRVMMGEVADFWWKAIHPDGATMDEATFREGMLRLLRPAGKADEEGRDPR